MPSCLRCGRNVDDTDLFCPRCLQITELEDGDVKRKIPLLRVPKRTVIKISLLLLVIFAFLALGIRYYYNSQPLTVPDSFPTIQEAIDKAAWGDTIVVKPGIYFENIDFMGKDVTVRSTRPQDPEIVASTVIQGDGTRATVSFQSGEGSSAVLRGMTISGRRFHAHGTTNVEQDESTSSIIAGGAIFISSGSAPVIKDNIITGGVADRGGALYISNAAPLISNNLIHNNRARWQGGAIFICFGAKPVITENIIENNRAEDGAGIYLMDSSPQISGNLFRENRALYCGGGIMCMDSEGEICNNSFELNRAEESGGGVYLLSSSLFLDNNRFAGNAGGWRGGGALYLTLHSTAQLGKNSFEENEAPEGKDIWVSVDSSFTKTPDDEQTWDYLDIYCQE